MKYTAQDFKSNQEVRWCPGCGDHAVLAALQRALPQVSETLGIDKEKFVVVSGIGCSSRLPYYMDTFGFHGIHGRATALSTGLKVARPDLCVWQACGDGDALAIGGNHFIHAIRRNVDLNIVLFNNQIYGLTKGQYSPTSKFGAITKTSPYGTVENPFTPGQLVIGARGTFFARGLDVDIKTNQEIFLAAALHKGASVCEMLTNCVIFNDGAHAAISAKEVRADRTIILHDGEKMIFGANNDKGIVLENGELKAVKIGEGGYTMDDILVHHADTRNTFIHSMLIDMKDDLPMALGVIRNVADSTYDENVENQLQEVTASAKVHSVDELLRSGSTWEVK